MLQISSILSPAFATYVVMFIDSVLCIVQQRNSCITATIREDWFKNTDVMVAGKIRGNFQSCKVKMNGVSKIIEELHQYEL